MKHVESADVHDCHNSERLMHNSSKSNGLHTPSTSNASWLQVCSRVDSALSQRVLTFFQTPNNEHAMLFQYISFHLKHIIFSCALVPPFPVEQSIVGSPIKSYAKEIREGCVRGYAQSVKRWFLQAEKYAKTHGQVQLRPNASSNEGGSGDGGGGGGDGMGSGGAKEGGGNGDSGGGNEVGGGVGASGKMSGRVVS